METEKLYKTLLFVGSGWNFAVAGYLLLITGSLPSMLGIEPPRYPIFIHFNLMSIFFFGCMQWMIALDLRSHRRFIKLIMWAKFGMVGIFAAYALPGSISQTLIGFLAPGMIVDALFGLLFWRFLVFAKKIETL